MRRSTSMIDYCMPVTARARALTENHYVIYRIRIRKVPTRLSRLVRLGVSHRHPLATATSDDRSPGPGPQALLHNEHNSPFPRGRPFQIQQHVRVHVPAVPQFFTSDILALHASPSSLSLLNHYYHVHPSNLDIWTETVRTATKQPQASEWGGSADPRQSPHMHTFPLSTTTTAIAIIIALITLDFTHAVWPRLLFQLPLPMARHVLHRSAPERTTDGIRHVSFSFLASPAPPHYPCEIQQKHSSFSQQS